jgi:putative DNA primase/helicase
MNLQTSTRSEVDAPAERDPAQVGCLGAPESVLAPPTKTDRYDPVAYSRGRDKFDNHPEQREAADFDEFLEGVLNDRAQHKGEQYFCAALGAGVHSNPSRNPGEGHWRQKHLVRPRRYLPVDIDGMAEPQAFQELRDFLKRFHGAAYTTSSHSIAAPRCRLVLELDRGTNREEGIALGKAFQALIESELGEGRYVLDKSVFQGEQPCYCPLVGSEVYRFDGAPIQVDDLLARFPQTAAPARGADRDGRNGDHKDWKESLLVGDDVHGSLLHLVGRWVALGWTDDAIRDVVDVLLERVADVRGVDRVEAVLRDGELDRMIEGARAKGFAPRNYEDILADAEALTRDSPIQDIRKLVIEAAKGGDPLEQEAVFRQIKDRTGYGMAAIRAMANQAEEDLDPDHLDMARDVIAAVGGDNLIETQGQLWQYNGSGVWEPREERGIRQLVQTHVDEHFPGVKKTQNLITSVVDVLRNQLYRPHHDWDIGPADSVSFPNGELVLEDEKWVLREHCREHYRTTQIPHEYDPNAVAPRFTQFLDEVFLDDPDKQDKGQLILEMLGYTLMAHSRYEKATFLDGTGRNGKSVLLKVVEEVCGKANTSFVQPAQMERVFQRDFLKGKLANIVTEMSEGALLQDAEIKALTSGEASTTEAKYGNPRNTRTFATFWFGTNHLPRTRDVSDAMLRRVVIVPFNQRFVHGENADPYLADKLRAECPGIIRLALDAYAGVVQRGAFTMPQSSQDALRKWVLITDQVRCFIDERCEVKEGGKVGSDALYMAYQTWTRGTGIRNTFNRHGFNERVEGLGYAKRRETQGNFFHGLELSTERSGWGPTAAGGVEQAE